MNIEKGMKSGQRIPLRKEGDQLPGTTPGDIIIVLQEKEHELFHRDEADLIIEHKVGLTEALCGFKMTVQHLDGRVLLLNCKPGEIIQPGKYMSDRCRGRHNGSLELPDQRAQGACEL